MEIEAKFVLPDLATFHHLQSIDLLAGFVLSTGEAKQVRDTYLDTAERLILAAGYSCRQREQHEGVLLTLKGLKGAEGAVHRREELEMLLSDDQPADLPQLWPSSPLRDQVHRLIGDASLVPLFTLQQARTIRQVSRGERQVAELSLDQVHLNLRGREQVYFELEAELAPQGTEDDLAAIVTCLQDDWGLEPESRSKFERALDFAGEVPLKNALLMPQERAVCQQIATRDDLYARRASALLALDVGAKQVEAGERAGLSARRVRHWLAEFRQKRLGVFPERVLDEIYAARASTSPEPLPEQEFPPGPVELCSEMELKFKPSVGVGIEVQEQPAELVPHSLPDKPGLEADDSMAEAARKTFLFHLQRMVYHEPGTRLGEDIEELHDMRVATRRMRAAFNVFGDYLDLAQMAPFLKGLRRTGRALGAVRDLDVFWEKTQCYLDDLPTGQQLDLEPLRTVWAAERERARERMLAYLDSDRYIRFKARFSEFLQKPGAGGLPIVSPQDEPLPHRLRHVVPVAVYQRLAAVRAYDEWVNGPDVPLERLHQLRIAAKGLRYTVEYFREVLGPEAKALIKKIKALQDHLGNLQDAVVASNLLRDFLTWGTWGQAQTQKDRISRPAEPVIAPGVAAYLAARQTELQHLIEIFPQIWVQFQDPEFSQLVATVVAVL